jgi:hypothetical protein
VEKPLWAAPQQEKISNALGEVGSRRSEAARIAADRGTFRSLTKYRSTPDVLFGANRRPHDSTFQLGLALHKRASPTPADCGVCVSGSNWCCHSSKGGPDGYQETQIKFRKARTQIGSASAAPDLGAGIVESQVDTVCDSETTNRLQPDSSEVD